MIGLDEVIRDVETGVERLRRRGISHMPEYRLDKIALTLAKNVLVNGQVGDRLAGGGIY